MKPRPPLPSDFPNGSWRLFLRKPQSGWKHKTQGVGEDEERPPDLSPKQALLLLRMWARHGDMCWVWTEHPPQRGAVTQPPSCAEGLALPDSPVIKSPTQRCLMHGQKCEVRRETSCFMKMDNLIEKCKTYSVCKQTNKKEMHLEANSIPEKPEHNSYFSGLPNILPSECQLHLKPSFSS